MKCSRLAGRCSWCVNMCRTGIGVISCPVSASNPPCAAHEPGGVEFSNASTSTHLIEAAGNKSKLIELLVLDDDQVAELNDGGTVAGITLDDVAAMSVSDLRKALREARADAEANDKLLAEKTTRSTRSRRSATPLLGASRQRSPTNSWWACTRSRSRTGRPGGLHRRQAPRRPGEAVRGVCRARSGRCATHAPHRRQPARYPATDRRSLYRVQLAPGRRRRDAGLGQGRVRRRRWEPRQCCHRGRAGRRCPCLARCAARA